MKSILNYLVAAARARLDGFADNPLHESYFADFIAAACAGMIRHSSSWGWLVYDPGTGVFIHDDRAGKIVSLYIEEMAKELIESAFAVPDADHRDAVIKFACRILQAKGEKNIKTLLVNRHHLSVTAGAFDAAPFMLNCRGVAVDLRTGKQRPAEPGDLFMKCAGYKPLTSLEEAYGKIPNFTRFIADITLKEKGLAQYLMYFLGYSLTADMREQCYLNFWGAKGKNGKSTLLNLVRHIWGDYCVEAPQSVVLNTRKDDRFDMQFIEGARLVIKADIPPGAWVKRGNIKDITGGDEGFYAEKKYHDGFVFHPKCKIILSSNHRLRLGETGGAVERRVRLMPFRADFRINPDPRMKEKLDEEAPAILTVLIDYARKWYGNGLPASETVEQYSAEYILDEDVIRQFAAEKCVREEGASVQVTVLYDAFKAWLKSSKPPSRKDFKDRMAERGFDCRKEARANENRLKSCFFGIRLLGKGEEKPPEQAELLTQDPALEQISGKCSNVPKFTPVWESSYTGSDNRKKVETTPFFGTLEHFNGDVPDRNPFDDPEG